MRTIFLFLIVIVLTANSFAQDTLVTNCVFNKDGETDLVSGIEYVITIQGKLIKVASLGGRKLFAVLVVDTLEYMKSSTEFIFRMTTLNPERTVRFWYKNNVLTKIAFVKDYETGKYYYFDSNYKKEKDTTKL